MVNPIYAALLLFALGAGVTDLSGTLTLTTGSASTQASAHFQIRNPNGSNRNVLLPSLISVTPRRDQGLWYMIRNAGSANNLVVKDSTGVTTYATLAPGDWVWMVSSGSPASWYVAAGSTTPTTISLTGALSAATGTFTGRVTTTDGVTSGDARVVGGISHAKQTTTTVTNTTTETAIGSHSVPANTIKAGTTVRVRGSFKCTGNAGGHTATLRIKLGAVELLNTSALNTVANDVCEFEAIVSGRAAPGASVALASLARASYQQGGTLSSAAAVKDAATYTGQATNGALVASATIQWSAASASDIITCDQFTVEVIG